ncbi:D-hexose-6-phosphate mutarotase [Vogesella sp. LIG4]|uniref:D-hexose-6-phosphate mutarotase n=1 Tax=Vogesella sp. LIG4 TaxID=1192162 RepID=UPI0008201A0E|nr:D-hexose-6-phosphate mutarotase [Vogesella sp. LIG4]SCK12242.1 glucose-6-phosphate 1-epimerase [Vogesella sp. LIG4]
MSHPVHPDLLVPGVRAIELAPGLPGLAFSHPAFSATLSLYGGQLLDFTPTGGQPLLYLSPASRLEDGKAIRGGIPLCWPWFGPHPQDAGQPQHGVARTALWTVSAVARSDDGFHVKLAGPRHGAMDASLTLQLGPGVDIALTSRNLGQDNITVSAALHSYLAVSDIRSIQLHGLGGARYHDKLSGDSATLPAGDWRFAAATDAVVQHAGPCTLADPGWQRHIAIGSSGSASTVVWTPWQQGAANMADLPDDGWQHFLCVEAANAGSDARVLAPGASHTLRQQLLLQAL